MSDLVDKARSFAKWLHRDQKRKYTNQPYAVHLQEVAHLIETCTAYGDKGIAAAWLHDSMEDQEVTFELLESLFGLAIAHLVYEVTDVSTRADGNRVARKQKDKEHLAIASPAGKSIKLADIISNCADIRERDPEFAVIYLEEKRSLMNVLSSGDPKLYGMAQKILTDATTRETRAATNEP